MKKFIHIITTRFNVPTEIWKMTRDGKKPLSDEWLEDRFEIFRQYCLPSFKNQSEKNFIWLVFFDKQTPAKYLKIIYDIEKECKQFKPVFVQDFPEMNSKILELIPKYFEETTEFIISTDIDNDDMLHKDFIKTVQCLFQPKHNLVIDLRKGLQLTIFDGCKAFANTFYMVSNPFVSLVENISDFKSVIKESHPNYRNYENYFFYDQKPMFIQFIHQFNLLNQTNFKNKRLFHFPHKDFGINSPKFEISVLDTALFNIKRSFNLILKKLN